jgi:hypothetical protein
LSHNDITSDNLIADMFKVKLPAQDKFVYWSSLSLFLA